MLMAYSMISMGFLTHLEKSHRCHPNLRVSPGQVLPSLVERSPLEALACTGRFEDRVNGFKAWGDLGKIMV